MWDRTIVYDANVRYVDRDFTNTAVHSGRYADSYSARMTLAPGEATRGRTIEIFIHYFQRIRGGRETPGGRGGGSTGPEAERSWSGDASSTTASAQSFVPISI